MSVNTPYAVPDAVRPGDASGMSTAANADVIGRGAPGDSAPLAPFTGIGLDTVPGGADFQYEIPAPDAITLEPPVPPSQDFNGGQGYTAVVTPANGTTVAYLAQPLQPGDDLHIQGWRVRDADTGEVLAMSGAYHQMVRESDGHTSVGHVFDSDFWLPALQIDDVLGFRFFANTVAFAGHARLYFDFRAWVA